MLIRPIYTESARRAFVRGSRYLAARRPCCLTAQYRPARRYSGSRQLLILADTGGSNSSRCHAWKTELQSQLANSFALAVTVAHYPAGASKWNPIEHRLFSQVSRNWAGEPLDSYQKILNFARTTRTQTGLTVTACLDRRFYPCGAKPSPDQIASLRLQRQETLPEWNCTIRPQP